MDKQQARELIEKIFDSPFQRESYRRFLHDLLNEFEDRDVDYKGNLIPEAFKEHISQYWRIGKYHDPEGRELDLLAVQVRSFSKLDRARTALRNFAVNRLKTFGKDYALVAFYAQDDHGADWRFSFVKIEHEAYQDEKGKVKLKKELTPAKRYSYLVGEHENSHTAQKQLVDLLAMDYANPTIEEIETAFSVEKVTDEFFEQYKALYLKLFEHLKIQPFFQTSTEAENPLSVARFAKKLLGQIVFLYFLQKKGWLGVPQAQNWGNGDRRFLRHLYTKAEAKGQNFYTDYLQFLFYEALAQERKDETISGFYPRFNCRIPFLNGGLFEADYDWQKQPIDLPNDLFHNAEKNKAGDIGTGILDIFDRYNFTIKEDEPLEKEVAVDPEMLGKVFENMLDVTERKSKGAFYTPREIVHYMCQESLIHYLDNSLNTYHPKSEEITLFSATQAHEILVPKADLEHFIHKGHQARENDEHVLNKGHETDTYTFKLRETVRNHAKLIDTLLASIKACDPAIGSGAFPVGLLHEIVNARLALAPHSEIKQTNYELKRHSIQNSIYGADIDPSAIDIARLRLWLSLIVDEDDYTIIQALPNLDYKIVCGNSLLGFPENWKSKLTEEIERLKSLFFSETDNIKKSDLKKKINLIIQERMAKSESTFGYQVDFDFKLFFSEVWHEKGGFDIVIGNPPYRIEYSNQKILIEKLHPCFKRNNDLYVAFFEQGIKIVNKIGVLSFISPNSYLNGSYFKDLRKLILNGYQILEIINFGIHKVFSDPTVFVAITLITSKVTNKTLKLKTYDGSIYTSNYKMLNQSDFSDSFVPDDPIFSKILDFCEYKFGDVFFIKDVGFNYWTKGRGKSRSEGSIGNKVFLKEKLSPNDIPFIKGKDISPYHIEEPKNFLRCDYNDFLDPQIDTFRYSKELLSTIPKICYRQTASSMIAALDYNGMLCDKTVHIILNKQEFNFDLKYVVAILNSELFKYLYKHISQESSGKAFSQVKTIYVKEFPFVNNDSPLILNIVDYLRFISGDRLLLQKKYFQDILDCLIYEIFLYKDIQRANKLFLSAIGNLTPISDHMTDEAKLAVIQTEFDRLYDPNHPVRNNLETLDSVEVVKSIREALKK